MANSRRVSLYGAALAGAVLLLAALLVAVWGIDTGNPTQSFLEALNTGLTPGVLLALAGLLLWAVGWLTTNRHARPLTMAGAAERASQPRKAYLAVAQLIALLVGAALIWRLLSQLTLYFLDGADATLNWPTAVVVLAASSFLALAFWGYHEYEVSRDEDIGMERIAAARWRRGYVYAVILVGSVLTVLGAGELIRASIGLAVRPLSGDTTWHAPAAGALAALLVGVLLGALGWGRANRALGKAPAVEVNAPSRVLLRHGGVLFGSLVTLISLGYLIEQVLLRGVTRSAAGVTQRALFDLFDWTWALAYFPVAGIVWVSAARGVRADAAVGGETRRTGTIRRVVRYALAALALAAFWYGLVEFARLILQVLLGASAPGQPAAFGWLQRFATAAALLLIGAPAWWGHWWSQHVRARSAGPHGHTERASIIRRGYLVLIVLVGGVLVVAAAGFGVFLALNWQAAGELGGVRAAVAGAAAAAVVSLFWALSHGLVLRGDLKRLATDTSVTAASRSGPATARGISPVSAGGMLEEPVGGHDVDSVPGGRRRYSREELAGMAIAAAPIEAPHGGPGIVILDGEDGGMGVALINGLRRALPGIRVWPIGLNPSAEAAMVAALGDDAPADLPPDVFATATAILLPSDALAGGELNPEEASELSSAITGSSASVLLLPPHSGRFHWVAAPDWSRERWVENAVVEVGNLLDGLSR
jgi:hypothetical protein